MKTSRLLLSTLAAATLVACGNLSDINPDGTAKNLVWPRTKLATVMVKGVFS